MHLSYLILSSALSFQIFRKGLASSCCKSRIFDGGGPRSLFIGTGNNQCQRLEVRFSAQVGCGFKQPGNLDYSLANFSHHPKYIVRGGIVETNNLWDVTGGVLGSRALRTFF